MSTGEQVAQKPYYTNQSTACWQVFPPIVEWLDIPQEVWNSNSLHVQKSVLNFKEVIEGEHGLQDNRTGMYK